MSAVGCLLLCGLAASLARGAATYAQVDVSNLPGPQTNATITIDPRNPRILLAGSNSLLEGAERIYSSTDGGATWTTTLASPRPKRVEASCASDPGVAIDRTGRQYYSFVRSTPCNSNGVYRVYVVTRPNATAAWSKPTQIAPLGNARLDDKPTIAVDTSPVSRYRNRVYAAWSRLSRQSAFSVLSSHSDDGGRTWSNPVTVHPGAPGQTLTYASIGISRTGAVYVAWTDESNFDVQIARSTDGGVHFGPQHKVTGFVIVTIPHCGIGIVIPAEPESCVQADPTVSVDASAGRYSGRVYVTYTGTDFQGDEGAAITSFTSTLRPIAGFPLTGEHRLVAPSATHSDQFWTQSAVDPSTGGLWVCFYDTAGDPTRHKARYSCTVSRDGGRSWARSVRAATTFSDETQKGAAYEYGYYQGVAAADGVAHPIWTDTRKLRALGEEIYTTSLAEAEVPAPAPARR